MSSSFSTKRTGLQLTKSLLVTLYVFLVLVLVVSLFITTGVLYRTISCLPSLSVLDALIGSFSSAGMGSSIYYLRKLYKDSLSERLKLVDVLDEKSLGYFMYILLRPLFSLTFALVLFVGLIMENDFISKGTNLNLSNFIYVVLLASFFVGFGSGKVISSLEKKKASL